MFITVYRDTRVQWRTSDKRQYISTMYARYSDLFPVLSSLQVVWLQSFVSTRHWFMTSVCIRFFLSTCRPFFFAIQSMASVFNRGLDWRMCLSTFRYWSPDLEDAVLIGGLRPSIFLSLSTFLGKCIPPKSSANRSRILYMSHSVRERRHIGAVPLLAPQLSLARP